MYQNPTTLISCHGDLLLDKSALLAGAGGITEGVLAGAGLAVLFWDAAVHETLCWEIPCLRPAAATNIRGATVSMRPAPLPRPPLDFCALLSGGQPIAKLRAHAHCRMAFVRCHGAHFAGTTEMGKMAERPVDHFRRAQRAPRISKTASLESIGSDDTPRGRRGAMGVARVWGVNALDGKLMWSDLSSVGFGTLTVELAGCSKVFFFFLANILHANLRSSAAPM